MTLFATTSCDQQVPENTYMQFIGGDSGSIVMETNPGYYTSINGVLNQTSQILDTINSARTEQQQTGFSVTTPQGTCCGPLLVDMLDLNQHDNTDLSFYQEYASEMNKNSCSEAFQSSIDPFCGNTDSMMGSQAIDLTSGTIPGDDLEQVQSLVVDEVTKEINYACAVLNISQDPYHWSVDDVQRWVYWTLDHYKQPILDLEHFQMDGTNLSMLPEQEFRYRSPQNGATLYAHLDVWKNACYLRDVPSPCEQKYYPMSESTSQGAHSGIPSSVVNFNQSMPSPTMQSPRSVSPVGSEASTDSSYSSLPSPHVKHEGYESPRCQIQLWQFLRELLNDPTTSGSCIRWLDRSTGIFKIEDSTTVAKLWGKRKNRPAMNYDKLSRSIRQYYKKGIIKKTIESKRLVYQFCPKYLV